MNSEAAAYACATQRHHRYMIFGKKQRYIEVFQCSGEDMNLVLTGAPLPGKALLSPGPLTATAGGAPTPGPPAQAQVPVPTPQPAAPLWDIHAFVQAQAQAQAQVQAQAQAQAQVQAQAQAQAAQAQALRNQDLWLMALAQNNANPNASPGSPNSTSKALALPSSVAQHPHHPHHHHHHHGHPSLNAAYAPEQLHAQAVAQHAAATNQPLLFFNVPQTRIPLLRAHAPPGFLTQPLMPGAPINPAALIGLKRSWESAFPTETAAAAPKRATWQTPAAAFHASAAQTGAPTLAYPAQFFPQI